MLRLSKHLVITAVMLRLSKHLVTHTPYFINCTFYFLLFTFYIVHHTLHFFRDCGGGSGAGVFAGFPARAIHQINNDMNENVWSYREVV
ncbi:hypothetical protein [Epilithonimonas bovis]|uniref:hypothetical protein n=1 Tax=Epilithonimonas bovis TaxID=421530 RepID=UPI0011801E96|nr:hypothetical protein [Epilithonimonas bovis]